MFYNQQKKKKKGLNTEKKQIFQIPIYQHWSYDILILTNLMSFQGVC